VAWIGFHYGGEDLPVNDFVKKIDDLVDGRFLHRKADAHDVDRYSAIIPAAGNVRSVVEAIKNATMQEGRTIDEIVSDTGKPKHAVQKYVPILVAVGVLDEAIGHQPWKLKWRSDVEEVFNHLDTWMESLTSIHHQIELAQADLDIRRLGDQGELL
jgi:hypothetical protein